VFAQGQVDHRGDGKTAFGGQTHAITPRFGVGTLLADGRPAITKPESRRPLTRAICSSIT
jgi:hypothetical protein